MENRDKLLFPSSGLTIALTTSNTIATKLITLYGVTLLAGIIVYLLTFLLTDTTAGFGER